MKEIEVKVKIDNQKEILQKLQELGCKFSEPMAQNDIIFVPKGFTLGEDFKGGINFLRIRQSQGRNILTLKQPQSNELDCIEKELDIDKPDDMIEILKLLGYEEAVRVNKTRIKCNYQDYEICVDHVEGLGDFIETERLLDEDSGQSAEDIQDESFAFLETLGVDKANRQENGYDTLMYKKLNT